MFEINLVPDIKEQVIKAQRIRNFILFVCIVVSAAAVGIVLILFAIKGAQDINMASQNGRLEKMSQKLSEYKDLDEILTLQGQLNKIDEISNNKKVFSRVFSIIGTLLPTNADRITISELNVNLGENTFTIKGQADAGEEPYIDYRVLEAFKKSMSVMKFDYGRYVDKNGKEIPTRCIIEADDDGNVLMDENGQYVNWTKGKKGCDPSLNDESKSNDENEVESDSNETEKIYRIPKFVEWYNAGHMTESGEIINEPHFASECIVYQKTGGKANKTDWVSQNNCDLTVDDRITISNDSSNARDESGNLVLKFSATIYLDNRVLSFKNKHMMAIAPSGRQNMTDSYLQIEGMFAKEAEECAEDDETCLTNKMNRGA